MNYLVEVCLIALTVTTGISPSAVAQSASRADQPLQKGISVESPITTSTMPVPDADEASALIVSFVDDGSMYFDINPANPAAFGGNDQGSAVEPVEEENLHQGGRSNSLF